MTMQASFLGFCLALSCAGGAMADDALAARGARLAAERCAVCHGANGQGNASDLPSLAGQHAEYIVKQLFHFKTGERANKPMEPVVAELSAADVEALAAHFSALPPRKGPPTAPALLARGRDLYFRGNHDQGLAGCVACHGPDGAGGAQMPRIVGQSPVYLETQLRNFAARTRQSDRGMHLGLEVLSADDLRALAGYLANED